MGTPFRFIAFLEIASLIGVIVSQVLKLTPSERVYCLKRLRFVNSEQFGAVPPSPRMLQSLHIPLTSESVLVPQSATLEPKSRIPIK